MAKPIKQTPVLRGREGYLFLKRLIAGPVTISKEELERRSKNYNFLESIRKF